MENTLFWLFHLADDSAAAATDLRLAEWLRNHTTRFVDDRHKSETWQAVLEK